MLLVVTLMRDSADGVHRFIDRNLRHGADGVVVFLDHGSDPVTVPEPLRDHVVLRRLDEAWDPAAVRSLNGRQRVLANLAHHACARAGAVDWMFFIDGDEVALLDREVLASVPREYAVARLWPLESVSDPEASDRTLFKRLLTPGELEALVDRGLLERPSNGRYFHGHTSGKVGIRPGSAVRLKMHSAKSEDGEKVACYEDPRLRHLHLESWSFEEFVRKWEMLAGSGKPPGVLGRRRRILRAFLELQDLPPPRRVRRQRRLYDKFVREDAAALLDAGVLERVDPEAVTARPRSGPGDLAPIADQVDRLMTLRPRMFLPSTPADALARVLQELDEPEAARPGT